MAVRKSPYGMVIRSIGLDHAAYDHQGALIVSKEFEPNVWRPSARQTEILVLLAQGQTYKAIAARLKLTPATVSYHVGRMQQSSRARSLPMLIAKAFFFGFLTAELLPMFGADDLPLDGN